MLTKLILLLVISLLYINSSSTAYASDQTLVPEQELNSVGFTKYESINPNLLIYPLKQIGENMEITFLANKKEKVEFQYTLLDKRFKELVYIINFKKTGFLKESVGLYNANIGNGMLQDKASALSHKDKILSYIRVLKTLQDRYDSISSYRLLIQQAIDTTRRLI